MKVCVYLTYPSIFPYFMFKSFILLSGLLCVTFSVGVSLSVSFCACILFHAIQFSLLPVSVIMSSSGEQHASLPFYLSVSSWTGSTTNHLHLLYVTWPPDAPRARHTYSTRLSWAFRAFQREFNDPGESSNLLLYRERGINLLGLWKSLALEMDKSEDTKPVV